MGGHETGCLKETGTQSKAEQITQENTGSRRSESHGMEHKELNSSVLSKASSHVRRELMGREVGEEGTG